MGYALDFQDIKQKVKIEDVAAWLNLDMNVSGNQLRSSCPACQSKVPATPLSRLRKQAGIASQLGRAAT